MLPETFYEVFSGLPRQGPGDNEFTRKAYKLLPDLPARPRILDIGCGTGMQTLELARISGGRVTALDNYPPFLDSLEKRIRAEGLAEQIETVNASMMELPFGKSTFDIIWSEGAIFIIGFEKGLSAWKPFIKPGGYLVVSEMAWIRPDPPREIRAYFEGEYPAMKSDEENKEIIRRAGYDLVSSFILPTAVWRDGFYEPMQARVDALKKKYAGKREQLEILHTLQQEIDMHARYSAYYSYGFYIMQTKGGAPA